MLPYVLYVAHGGKNNSHQLVDTSTDHRPRPLLRHAAAKYNARSHTSRQDIYHAAAAAIEGRV